MDSKLNMAFQEVKRLAIDGIWNPPISHARDPEGAKNMFLAHQKGLHDVTEWLSLIEAALEKVPEEPAVPLPNSCPYCISKAEVFRMDAQRTWVRCTNRLCNVSGPGVSGHEAQARAEAVRLWNQMEIR